MTSAPPGNRFVSWLLRSPLHPLLGNAFALITVTGRRTGKRYTTPINLNSDPEGWYVISSRERTWWRNLCPTGDAVLLHRGRSVSVKGETVEAAPAVEEALRQHVVRNPSAARYLGIRRERQAGLVEEDLRREGGKRVIIRLKPVT
jgi:deazaflavin-dependent oxidoreductase (nitroreductase family)